MVFLQKIEESKLTIGIESSVAIGKKPEGMGSSQGPPQPDSAATMQQPSMKNIMSANHLKMSSDNTPNFALMGVKTNNHL